MKRTTTDHVPGLPNPWTDPTSTAAERLAYQAPRFDRRAVPWSDQIRYALDHPEEFPPPQPGETPNPISDTYELRRLAHDRAAGEAEYLAALAREGREPPEPDQPAIEHTPRDQVVADRLGAPVDRVAAIRADHGSHLSPARIEQILKETTP